MDSTILNMELQLRNWRLKIDCLAHAVHGVGTRPKCDALVYIDELKAMHAIARARLDEFSTADGIKRRHLEDELYSVWVDLDAAIENVSS